MFGERKSRQQKGKLEPNIPPRTYHRRRRAPPTFNVALVTRAKVGAVVRTATTRGHRNTTKLKETNVELFYAHFSDENGVGAGESAVRS